MEDKSTLYFEKNFKTEIKALVNLGSVKLLGILLVILLLFHKIIALSYKNLVVDKVLHHIETSNYSDFVFGILFLIVFFISYTRIKTRKRISTVYFIYVMVVTIIYLYYRNEKGFTFFYFKFSLPYFPIRYSDILLLLFSMTGIEFLFGLSIKFSEPVYNKVPFEIDLPIGESSEDLFGRKQFAEVIADKIKSKYDKESSLAIGIDGPWGSGKTSFIVMLKEAIKQNDGERDRIIIDFHPWKSSSPQQIIADFFDVFTAEIKKISPNLSNNISNYARTLTKVDDNIATKSLDVVLDVLNEDQSKECHYKSINDALKNQNKQIIVIIDDVDRLDKREIIEVIRLIRNTASFHNTIFIVTYEREYIQNAIKELNEYHFKQYLDKIFQFEFTLTPILRQILMNELFTRLTNDSSKLLDSHKDAIKSLIFLSDEPSEYPKKVDLFGKHLNTIRDVVRYSNSFLIDYIFIKNEINVQDFALLQLLKLKYPTIYDTLYEKRDKFLLAGRSSHYPHPTLEYSLKSEKVEKTDVIINPFKDYLNDDCSGLKYKKCEIEDILELVNSLFEDSVGKRSNREADKKSIRIADNFKSYFINYIYEGEISTSVFESAFFTSNTEDFKKLLDEWLEKGYTNNIMIRLSRINIYDLNSKEDYKKLIRTILHFTWKTSLPGSRYLFDMNRFEDLILAGKKGNIPDYSLSDHIEFIRTVFAEAKSPYLFESWFIRSIKKIFNDENNILSREEFRKIQIGYLQKYLNEITKIDQNMWTLLYDSKDKVKINESAGSYQTYDTPSPEVKDIFLEFLKKGNLLDDFIYSLIIRDPREDKLFRLIFDPIFTIFKNIEEFEEYIITQLDNPKSVYINEFYSFFKAFKENKFEKLIDFKFEKMPTPKRDN